MSTSVNDQIRDRASAVAEVSGSVSAWLVDTSAFLGVLQNTLEQVRPIDGASADINRLLSQLPVLLRQCRAQVPTPEMIRTWVATIINSPDRRP